MDKKICQLRWIQLKGLIYFQELIIHKINNLNYYAIHERLLIIKKIKMGIGDWGLGIGDWGLGIGPNPQSPIPNPQSPIPNPQSPIINVFFPQGNI